MDIRILLFVLLVLIIYPLVMPGKKVFIIGWFVVWYGLWGIFFFCANHESEFFASSNSAAVGIFISIFIVASSVRLFGIFLLRAWRSLLE